MQRRPCGKEPFRAGFEIRKERSLKLHLRCRSRDYFRANARLCVLRSLVRERLESPRGWSDQAIRTTLKR
jgi:hypothetical protein